ncbi:MAG: hypothetical protein JWP61_4 [Friedmanniella sp.]|nr:hypothetical protein [Friedmanniella sp.]
MTGPSAALRIQELQQRVQVMQGSALSRSLPMLPGLSDLIRLRTGSTYAVDSPSLAMALMAGPSQAGEWTAVVGVPDFGLEAAEHLGVDLGRVVLVPRPGEHWLSVTAGLLDVAGLVLVKPPSPVSEHQAARLKSRMRQKDAALLSWGPWPRSEATLSVSSSTWDGVGHGHGRLAGRRVVVEVTQSGPTRAVPLWLPGADRQVRAAEPAVRAVVQVAG